MKKLSRAAFTRGLVAAPLCVAAGLGTWHAALAKGASSSESDGMSAGKASAAADGKTVSFTDSCGREVQVPAAPTKIAPSGPLAQLVLLTFGPSLLCGLATELTDDQKLYTGMDGDGLPVFGQVYGGKGDFNKEEVAAAGTQLIIDIGEAKKTIVEDMDALQQDTGIACVHIESSISSYDSAYTLLGQLLGNEERAGELADYCKGAYESTEKVLAGIPEDQRVTIAFLTDETHAIAKGSFQGQVVDNTADNVVVLDDVVGNGQGNEISEEQLAAWDPQVLLVSDAELYGRMADDPVWSTLGAVSSDTYYQVPTSPYNWLSSPPSVNQVLGMQWLPRVCYPESFDDEMRDVVSDYFKVMYGYELTDDDWATIEASSVPRA